MNLVRHELGLSQTESRFPAKGTCLAIYSRAVNARGAARRACWRAPSRGARGWEARAAASCSPPTSRPSSAQNVLDYDDLLLYWAQMMAEPALAARHRRRASTTCWSTSTRTPTGCRPRSCSR